MNLTRPASMMTTHAASSDDFFDRMRDINDRYFEFVPYLLDQRHDFKLSPHVERRQRLIEQK